MIIFENEHLELSAYFFPFSSLFSPCFCTIFKHFNQFKYKVSQKFGASRLLWLKNMQKSAEIGVRVREEIRVTNGGGGEEIRVFGQNIYPWLYIVAAILIEFT